VMCSVATWESRWRPVLAEARGPTNRFAQRSHWSAFYERHTDKPFEWFVSSEVALSALEPCLKSLDAAGRDNAGLTTAKRILHVGCGTSTLGPLLAERGHHVTNIDFEESCLEMSRALHPDSWSAHSGTCEWLVHDAARLPAEWTGRFDVVLDKGGLCAVLFGGGQAAATVVRELHRCSNRLTCFITDDPPEQREEFLRAALGSDIRVSCSTIDLEEDNAPNSFPTHERLYFLYQIRK